MSLDPCAKSDYDRLATDYARHRTANPQVLKALARAVDGAATDKPEGTPVRVLEVGAGTGNHILALVRLTGCEGHGVEPSREMRRRAETRGGAAFHDGAAERLDFDDAGFDLVFSVDVIHHVENRPAYFAEARRVLKPGGRVCTATDSEAILRHREPHAAYFPETVAVELARYPAIADVRAEMATAAFTGIREELVTSPFWLDTAAPYRDKAHSCLHLIDAAAFARGLARLEADLSAGPIPCVSRYLLLWGTA